MKFGGTSVNDASCIAKVADIINAAASDSDVVVVVSAMRGVTDLLIEAATQSEAGNQHRATAIFQEVRQRHESAANALIQSTDKRQTISRKIHELVQQADSLCQEILLQRKLTLCARDSISGFGKKREKQKKVEK